MAFRVIWTDPAIGDLEEIVRYIARDNPSAARSFGKALFAESARLGPFPHTGRRWGHVEEDEILEIPYRGYRIFYQILEGQQRVEVLHIRHGARSEPKF